MFDSKTGRRVLRNTAAVVAFAVAGVTAAAAPAAASGDVLAHGRNVNGICMFDGVELPRGVTVRADETCRLVTSAPPDLNEFVNIGPPATVVPKKLSTSAAGATTPGGGVLPGVSTNVLDTTTDFLGNPAGLATAQVDYTTYRVRARWQFWNERGQLMYDDHLSFVFRRYNQDGNIFGIAPGDAAYCGTGVGVMPHQPITNPAACNWARGDWGGAAFGFSTAGDYADYIGVVPWDSRSLWMTYHTATDGRNNIARHEACSPLEALPIGWSTPGCVIRESVIS